MTITVIVISNIFTTVITIVTPIGKLNKWCDDSSLFVDLARDNGRDQATCKTATEELRYHGCFPFQTESTRFCPRNSWRISHVFCFFFQIHERPESVNHFLDDISTKVLCWLTVSIDMQGGNDEIWRDERGTIKVLNVSTSELFFNVLSITGWGRDSASKDDSPWNPQNQYKTHLVSRFSIGFPVFRFSRPFKDWVECILLKAMKASTKVHWNKIK